MKKVLIITYYWPPAGGSGVQRWVKFVKYLRQFEWEPVIYTPKNPEISATDPSLLTDIPTDITVLKTNIWEPYSWYKKFVGLQPQDKIYTGFLSEKEKRNWAEKIAIGIRGNLFIPDAKMFWIKPSIQFLYTYLQKHSIAAMISTGPPHSMHLIARGIKKRISLPWIADFRDPWTKIDFYNKLALTPYAHWRHRQLEKSVLQDADKIITISETMKKEFIEIIGRPDKFQVIPNGYDEDDFPPLATELDNRFSLAHIGSINRDRNLHILWEVLSQLIQEQKDFASEAQVHLIGKIDKSVKESIANYNLTKFVFFHEYMPHAEVIRKQQQAQVLLLLINNTPHARGILTGKLFEYLAARRPILAIGPPDGEVAKILQECRAGVISNFSDKSSLRKNILEYYTLFRNKALVCNSVNIEQYSRKTQTAQLAQLLEEVINIER